MDKIKLIIDTDIGDDVDDAFALRMAINSEEIELLGVTTVFRNAYARAQMAKFLINSYNLDYPVYAGEDNPLVQSPDFCITNNIKKKEKKDENGNYQLPQWEPAMSNFYPEKEKAVDFIINKVRENPYQITILAIGPLTNIAKAFTKDPELPKLIKEIRIMGGRVYPSNDPEWNIICDPEAANIVYSKSVNLKAVGINVTELTILNKEFMKDLKAQFSIHSTPLSPMLQKWFEHYERENPTMHDPLAFASLLDESIIQFNKEKVYVELNGDKRGQTLICEERGNQIEVASTAILNKFYKLFKDKIF